MNQLRQHAEQQFAGELEALARADDKAKPPNWKLSPWAVATYVLGGKLDGGVTITPKYVGDRRLVAFHAGMNDIRAADRGRRQGQRQKAPGAHCSSPARARTRCSR